MAKRAGTPIKRAATPHSKSAKAGNPKPISPRVIKADMKMATRPIKKV